MSDDIDKDMKKLMEELDDDMEFSAVGENIQHRSGSFDSKSKRKFLILGGVVVLVLIVLIVLLPRGNDKRSKGDLLSIQAKLNHLEKKLTDINSMKDRMTLLEKRGEGLQQLAAEKDKSVQNLSEELDKLSQKIDDVLQKRTVPVADKTEKPRVSQKQTTPTSSTKKQYHLIRTGENLYRISLRYGISLDELCHLNNITEKQAIFPGQKLLVTPGNNK